MQTFQGVVKQLLSHPSTDKAVVVTNMNINGSNLVLSTISGQIMLYNLSKREAKIDRPARNIKELISKLTIIKSCKVNTNGKLISLIVEEVSWANRRLSMLRFFHKLIITFMYKRWPLVLFYSCEAVG